MRARTLRVSADVQQRREVVMPGPFTPEPGGRSCLLCERKWTGSVPGGMTRVEVPHRSALVIGRVFAADDDDRHVAYALAKQIQLTPLDNQP